MERITRFRSIIMFAIVVVLIGFLAGRLYYLQIIETGGDIDNTTTFTTVTRVRAARGDILDRNGNVMVTNRASYDLVINHYVLTNSENPNQSLYELVQLCQEQGIEYTEHFPVTETAPFTYTLSDYNSTWQGYFQVFLESRGGLDSDITAPLLMRELRDSYNIPEEWTDEEARAVIGLRYELSLRPYTTLSNFVFLSDVDSDTLAAIAELNIPGMNVEASTVREYTTEYAAHVLGYIGAMSAEQWEYYKTVDNVEGVDDYLMDAEVGQSGFELAFEEQLHGIDGWRYDEVTADGTVIRSWYDPAPQAGSNVEVTIDLALQEVSEDSLADVFKELTSQEDPTEDGADAEGGAVVVIDVKTGQVLVSASYPTYDISSYFENYNELLNAEHQPLINRALTGLYPPGSTYKMSMVVAGINSGTITQHTEIVDEGIYTAYPSPQPRCLRYSQSGRTHGALNASEALKVSCNYFFYRLGDIMDIEDSDSVASALGLGEYTGVELFEALGYRSNPETKATLYSGDNAGFFPADKLMSSIGQSDNLFTPIQLCVYASTLANQGIRYRATFLSRVISSDYRTLLFEQQTQILSTLAISDEAYSAYSTGMQMVASESGGTAYGTFFNYPIAVAAKTGTAQTGIQNASDNGAFVCYAPADDPQIAIAIYGEKAGHGSSLAVIARDILDEYFGLNDGVGSDIFENQLG